MKKRFFERSTKKVQKKNNGDEIFRREKYKKNKVQKKTYNQFIRKGQSDEGKIMFNEEQQTKFQEIYDKMI